MKKSNERALCVPLLKKTKRIMKLTTLFSLGVACCISASTYAQGYKLSMNKQNSSIIEILKDIENNSEFTFFFNDNKVNVNKKASINVKDATLDEALAQVLKNTGYDYQIIDRQVLIKTASSSVSSVPSVQQNQKARYLRLDGRISSTFSFSSIFLRDVVCLLLATLAENRRMNSSNCFFFSSAFIFWF